MKQELLSAGIDIGTTTTQVIFSKLTVERKGSAFKIPEVKVTGKEVLYKSRLHFTPLISPEVIDIAGLKKIVAMEYGISGYSKHEISTGAAIITGETARKENAREVLECLSEFSGDFIVGTAGPELEAVLAGWGAGAGELSKKRKGSLINFDIGGGTTNAAVFFNGEVKDAFALDIGGRLVRLDERGVVTSVSGRIEHIIDRMGLHLKVGEKAEFEEMRALSERLAEMFLELLDIRPVGRDTEKLYITGGNRKVPVDEVMFSGGVAEYIYNTKDIGSMEEATVHGDFGPLLGYCIRKKVLPHVRSVVEPVEKIRATVVGAGNYSMAVSGSTIACPDGILPLKNIPVIKLFEDQETEETKLFQDKIAEKAALYMDDVIAIAFRGGKSPGYAELKEISSQIIKGTQYRAGPLIILIGNDFAKALGQMLQIQLGDSKAVICLDGIRVRDGCYVDLGKQIAGVVPVVIKTLIFNN